MEGSLSISIVKVKQSQFDSEKPSSLVDHYEQLSNLVFVPYFEFQMSLIPVLVETNTFQALLLTTHSDINILNVVIFSLIICRCLLISVYSKQAKLIQCTVYCLPFTSHYLQHSNCHFASFTLQKRLTPLRNNNTKYGTIHTVDKKSRTIAQEQCERRGSNVRLQVCEEHNIISDSCAHCDKVPSPTVAVSPKPLSKQSHGRSQIPFRTKTGLASFD